MSVEPDSHLSILVNCPQYHAKTMNIIGSGIGISVCVLVKPDEGNAAIFRMLPSEEVNSRISSLSASVAYPSEEYATLFLNYISCKNAGISIIFSITVHPMSSFWFPDVGLR